MFFGSKIKKEIKERSQGNTLWNYDLLEEAAHKTLAAYASAVNTGNSNYLTAHATAQYAQYASAMLSYMKANGLSVKSERKIWRFNIKEMSTPEDANCWFVAEVGVGNKDTLYEYGKEADQYAESIADNREEWQFQLENNQWLLNSRSIEPQYQSKPIGQSLKVFAARNNYAASGFTENWFATRGSWLTPLGNVDVLFSGASAFDPSYNNVMYQVAEINRQETDGFDGTYLIGHTKLGKQYEKIVVIPKAQLRSGKKLNPKERIALEWPQFNERFVFYAPSTARISALELVNPKFMQELYDMNSLAIVDIVGDRAVVFTKLDNGTLTEKDVSQMQQILQMAEKELAR